MKIDMNMKMDMNMDMDLGEDLETWMRTRKHGQGHGNKEEAWKHGRGHRNLDEEKETWTMTWHGEMELLLLLLLGYVVPRNQMHAYHVLFGCGMSKMSTCTA